MTYPFLTLNDETEITHTKMLSNNEVKVYVEKPDEKDGFHSAICLLPDYRWEEIKGFTDGEIQEYQNIIESVAHLIIEFSQCGGFGHATNI